MPAEETESLLEPVKLSKKDEIVRANVTALRIAGKTYRQIGKMTGLSWAQVAEIIRDEVGEIKRVSMAQVEEMRHLHHERLEDLFARVIDKINLDTSSGIVNDRVYLVILKILEREAKLLGLDKDRGPGNTGGYAYSWLENATPTQLIEMAKKVGVAVPEEFQTPLPFGSRRGDEHAEEEEG